VLSLDWAVAFRRELWLDALSPGSLEYIRSSLNPATDLPTYCVDPRAITYRRLAGYQNNFGLKELDRLLWWGRSVFICGGGDRVPEFLWTMAMYALKDSITEPGIGLLLDSVRQEYSAERQRISMKATTLPVSEWDRKVIEAQECPAEEALVSITEIASMNAFACAWHRHVTAKGLDVVEQVYAAASNIPVSTNPQFDPATIPYPSAWELDFGIVGHFSSVCEP
jgi:hypothetical protein